LGNAGQRAKMYLNAIRLDSNEANGGEEEEEVSRVILMNTATLNRQMTYVCSVDMLTSGSGSGTAFSEVD
jgi:hypothetical protein